MPSPAANPGLDESYRALYAEHVKYVWRSLRRLGVVERDCEDLAQDVFVAVHRRWAERDPGRPVKPWLFGFAFRIALGHKRRAKTTREIPTDQDGMSDVRDSSREVGKAMDARDAYLIVHEALAALPMEQRAVVILHDLDEVPAPAIAEELGVPLNTVYSRLRLGRERFRRSIAERLEGGDR